jgi:hypothetical protein
MKVGPLGSSMVPSREQMKVGPLGFLRFQRCAFFDPSPKLLALGVVFVDAEFVSELLCISLVRLDPAVRDQKQNLTL